MKSVSATNLSKMVFCEASVVRNARLDKEDRQRIAEGIRQHDIFEKALAGQGPIVGTGNKTMFTGRKQHKSSAISPSLAILERFEPEPTTMKDPRPALSKGLSRILVSVFIITLVVVFNSL